MAAMARRQAPAYAWPGHLVRGHTGQRLVYLDLNHWINLAKAATGHRTGGPHQSALTAVQDAASSGQYLFPLSLTHYMEMAGIQDPRQRADVANVMEEVSGFTTLLSRTHIMRLEVEAALDRAFDTESPHLADIHLLGHGIGHAMGKRGGLTIRSASGDATDEARAACPDGPAAFDLMLANAREQLERAVLRGPTDAEVPDLKANGWDPTVAKRIAENRAESERQLAIRLDNDPQYWNRLRDVVQARYMSLEVIDMLTQALIDRDRDFAEVITDRESIRAFADCMPSAAVHTTLTEAAHRNREKSWQPNDIFDIDALSLAVPYCDMVVTERYASHVLQAAHLPRGMETEVVPKLKNLAEWLDRQ
ncbi:hypothetical protein QF037_003261 [Streptomyces canus]|uniref:hypothetical protein n=1 Tax=Streptomyces canus TaxID=58343 RepID=UPI00277DFC80|nr:hypothetical protein [Streptomyces canus]MDQ0598916.1 hypothetical protein [Streptomyces canus]